MFSVILCIGDTDYIDKYSFLREDFENSGMGKWIKLPTLTGEAAADVMQLVKGRENWSMVIVHSGQSDCSVGAFFDELAVAAHREKVYKVHPPDKAWLILQKIRKEDCVFPEDTINLRELPPYCRLLEYAVDYRNGQSWLEELKLLCITVLFAVNLFPSENFVVYQRHWVNIDIHLEKLQETVSQYMAYLRGSMAELEKESHKISKAAMGHNIGIRKEISPITAPAELPVLLNGRLKKKKAERDREYYTVKSALRQELLFLQNRVEESRKQWAANTPEQELSEEDWTFVKKMKQEAEVKMVGVIADLYAREQWMDEERLRSERKNISALLLRWDAIWGLWTGGGMAFSAVMLVFFFTFVKVGALKAIDPYTVLFWGGLAFLFGIYIIGVMYVQNIFMKIKGKHALLKFHDKEKEYIEKCRKNFNDFAQAYYEIPGRQVLLWGHGKAVKQKQDKLARIHRHSDFCKNRISEIEEWSNLFGSEDVFADSDILMDRMPDILKEPEKEERYRLLNMKQVVDIPVTGGEKTVRCPFPFISVIDIKRDYVD